jgi:hypothetical protein
MMTSAAGAMHAAILKVISGTSAPTGPPPMKWSDSKYGYATEEDCNGEEAQA